MSASDPNILMTVVVLMFLFNVFYCLSQQLNNHLLVEILPKLRTMTNHFLTVKLLIRLFIKVSPAFLYNVWLTGWVVKNKTNMTRV